MQQKPFLERKNFDWPAEPKELLDKDKWKGIHVRCDCFFVAFCFLPKNKFLLRKTLSFNFSSHFPEICAAEKLIDGKLSGQKLLRLRSMQPKNVCANSSLKSHLTAQLIINKSRVQLGFRTANRTNPLSEFFYNYSAAVRKLRSQCDGRTGRTLASIRGSLIRDPLIPRGT